MVNENTIRVDANKKRTTVYVNEEDHQELMFHLTRGGFNFSSWVQQVTKDQLQKIRNEKNKADQQRNQF